LEVKQGIAGWAKLEKSLAFHSPGEVPGCAGGESIGR
jgi:hypothetical protein